MQTVALEAKDFSDNLGLKGLKKDASGYSWLLCLKKNLWVLMVFTTQGEPQKILPNYGGQLNGLH